MSDHSHHNTTHRWVLCPHCDMTTQLPSLVLGTRATCMRCETTLATAWHEPLRRPMAYAFSALVMLIMANLFPFISISVMGLTNQISLLKIPQAMVDDQYQFLATIFLLFVQIIPAVCLVSILLLTMKYRIPNGLAIPLAKGLFYLKNWGMAEIFLAGVLVSFVKLMAYGKIGLEIGFWPWCLFCLCQLRAFQCLERHNIWQRISPAPALASSPQAGITGLAQNLRSCPCCSAIVPAEDVYCPRCHQRGYARKPRSLQWTLSLLITSILLYVPANIMPIMVTDALGSQSGSNIIAGVIFLWNEGSWPIAMIIFIASILVPSMKILAIGWLSWNAGGYGSRDNHRMQIIYEVVEFVGRWSMVDVFVIAVLSALVRMGTLMNVYPASGALLFCLVVILTMFSAQSFDPRLLWDREIIKNNEGESIE
ncbi:membrane integrity-associated transporter subunit PqiA [Rosenbergiella australiborealis]|uniref:Membrane integrity-associated transporter subunit PqiA n=1 Tax=Rosenbergiella australiborealis TaxID=1544696 RepID=A0ABS5T3K9_9GAMM|nr:membrane integrity-associated transporter subunit PqiA [Rosenbergiella australiborealis]MBT0726931.1 membrane integrity-associated transporter subunit PqiA [Rosenbergiella australiborealis]